MGKQIQKRFCIYHSIHTSFIHPMLSNSEKCKKSSISTHLPSSAPKTTDNTSSIFETFLTNSKTNINLSSIFNQIDINQSPINSHVNLHTPSYLQTPLKKKKRKYNTRSSNNSK